MKWTVVWRPAASNRLAQLWLNAADRASLTAAADRIDRALRNNPDSIGRELGEFRYLDEPPLAVAYSVSSADRIAAVLDVWVMSLDDNAE